MSIKVQWQCDACGMIYDLKIDPPTRIVCKVCGHQEIIPLDGYIPERIGNPNNPECKDCKIPVVICEMCRLSIPNEGA